MLLLRKIDCYGQLVLTVLLVLTAPMLSIGIFFTGLVLIGCWQIISAICNTYSFTQTGFEKRILFYWVFCVADLVLFYFSYGIQVFANSFAVYVFAWAPIAGAAVIAAYYWRMYYKFIEFIALRNELDGLTKSKHRS